MTATTATAPPTPAASRSVWAGRILSGLVVAMLAMDAGGKLFAPELMIANSPPLGLPADPGFHRLLGAILAICTLAYAVPRTSVIGAVLLTGYLGGLGRHAPARRQPAARLHAVRGVSGRAAVGRAVAARRTCPRAVESIIKATPEPKKQNTGERA